MAELADDLPYTDAATAISQGKRLLLVRDYTAAVTALAEGLELLSRKYGEFGDELGEPYLLYGRALLGLARSESSVLGNGVLGSEEVENDNDDTDNDDDDDDDDDDEDEEDDDDGNGCNIDDVSKDISNNVNNEKQKKTDNITENVVKNNEDDIRMNITDSIPIEVSSTNCDTKTHQKTVVELKNNIPSSSKEISEDITMSSQINQDDDNGEENQDENIENDEDEPSRGIDLQVSWEVLELAKNIFLKREPPGYKHLAETYRLLGEVAMESGNYEVAASEFKQAIGFLENLKPYEFRAIADLHYQLGLVHSSIHEFDISIEQFHKAINLLQNRIKQLEAIQDIPNVPSSDDPFYSIEGEIAELKDLLPEIQEKITDAKDFKQETCQRLIDGIKNSVNHVNDTGSPSSTSKIVKPTSDISHLVRKKRKATESEIQNTSPCKKTP